MPVSSPALRSRSRGFSLIEVMVALVIAGVGLLGLAKMEAVALSSTGVAAQRSLAAVQASSIAAAMHANRDYWTIWSNTPITISAASNPYSAAAACTQAAPCAPPAMAASDLNLWALDLAALLPGYSATISCPNPGASLVVSCAIKITWQEGHVAADGKQINMSNINAPDYTLYVQP